MNEADKGRRGLLTGVSNIIRFNPGFYVVGGLTILAGSAGMWLVGRFMPDGILLGGWIALAIAGWWFCASLAVSFWIYDLSGLYRWDWLSRRLPRENAEILVAHAGFDEVTLSLRRRFPTWRVTPLDFHDATRMTEPSIRRARRRYPPLPDTILASLEAWPIDQPIECVLFSLSAHEWRMPGERTALLRAASESLAPGGRIVLLEHLRDIRNFIAFGPGFLHFHSTTTWRNDWTNAGLECVDHFQVAGFLGGFVLIPDAQRGGLWQVPPHRRIVEEDAKLTNSERSNATPHA
jgi:SAM-dependent methyltransferase